jgi:hypothetical protein
MRRCASSKCGRHLEWNLCELFSAVSSCAGTGDSAQAWVVANGFSAARLVGALTFRAVVYCPRAVPHSWPSQPHRLGVRPPHACGARAVEVRSSLGQQGQPSLAGCGQQHVPVWANVANARINAKRFRKALFRSVLDLNRNEPGRQSNCLSRSMSLDLCIGYNGVTT